MGIWSIEEKKGAIYSDVILTTGYCTTLSQCIKEGKVLYELYSRNVKR